jgi:membrane dipeptidase
MTMNRMPSRRNVLTMLAGGGTLWLRGLPLAAAEPDPRVAQIVAGMVAVDMHNHLTIATKDRAASAALPDIDLARHVTTSGFTAICQTYSLDGADNPDGTDYYPRWLRALAFQDALLARNHMRRALSVADLQAAHARNEPIVVQTVEGALFLEGRLERLEEAYGHGLRNLQLIHDRDASVRLGDSTTGVDHRKGLTPFGRQVLIECNRLGILVDLAHCTFPTVSAALKVVNRPVIVSHAGMTIDFGGRRPPAGWEKVLLTAEQARAIAEAGGVIGVWYRLFDTFKDYVAAIRARVEAIGVDHVGIGTDSDMTAAFILPYSNQIWADQNGGLFHALVAEMLRQGFTPEEIAKIGGGNYCRVFAQATAGHSA